MLLSQRSQTPRELHAAEPSIPLGTLYRHLNVLLEAGIIKVVRERRVHGTVERQFALEEGANYYSEQEGSHLETTEIARIAGVLTSLVSQDFERYAKTARRPYRKGELAMVATSLLLTDEEIQDLRRIIKEYIAKEGRQPAQGLERRLFAFFLVPQPEE